MVPPPTAEQEHSWLARLDHRSVFPAAVFGMVAVALAAELTRRAPPDLAFLLYAAGRVLDGATLYREVLEINPPLIVWLNLPVKLVARALGISDVLLYRLCAAAAVGGLFRLCYYLVRAYVAPDNGSFGRYLLLLLCFALFPLAGEDFGQREHFVLALFSPYLLLAAARLKGQPVAPRDAAGVGGLAGMAVALKPQFVAVWLVLEIFVWVRSPRERGAAPELLGALGVLTAYGIAVVLLTPQYLGLATALGPAYSHYLREPIYSLAVLAPGVPLVLFAFLALAALRPYARDRQLWELLAAAVGAAYLGGLVQGKGFRYHFYPSLGLGFVLLGLIALDAPHSARRVSERLYARVSRVLLATIVLVVFGAAVFDVTGGGQERRQRDSEATELATFVRGHSKGRPVAVLSYNIASAFPLVTEAAVPLASRFPHLWPFAEAYWDSISAGGALQYHTLAEMKPPERFLWDAVRWDLLDAQPQLILVLRPARDAARNGLRRLHYLQYFGRDSALAALFRQYELIAEKGEYQVFQRVPEGTRRTGPAPSAEPGRLDVKRAQLQEVRLQILDPSFLAGTLLFAAVWLASMMIDRWKRRTAGVRLTP